MFKRILMNAADASPGNGAVPAPAPSDAPPQAQGEQPAALESLVANLAAQLDSLSKSVNSLHAADRRAREAKPAPKQEPKNDSAPHADDPSSLLALRDSFDDATAELKLTKGQKQILRDQVMSKRPSDVDGFVSDFASRAGWLNQSATQPAPAPQATAVPKPSNDRPVSDRGSPPPSQVPIEEQDLVTMAAADRDALIKSKGLKWYREQLSKQLKGRSVSVRR